MKKKYPQDTQVVAISKSGMTNSFRGQGGMDWPSGVIAVAVMAMLASVALSGTMAGVSEPLDSILEEPTQKPVFEPSRVVIGFEDKIPEDVPEYVAASKGMVVMEEPALGFIVVSVEPERNAVLLEDAKADPRVAYAELDSYVHSMQFTPDDTLWGTQVSNVGTMNLPEAWDITLGSHDVNIHILDTGVDHTHLDLLPNISPRCDDLTSLGRSTMGSGFTPLFTGAPGGQETGIHGTHVAGIAGAVIDNGLGIAGTSQSCMTSVQVLAVETGFDTWVAAGIRWSTDNGADVISMSLGGPNPTGALGSAVQYADNNGALLVAAAGNDDCGPVGYPAAYDEVMAVGAINVHSQRAPFSNCGPELEISAPGVNIWSALPGNTYAPLSGTSMATPFVSGIAGLVWDVNQTLSHTQVRCILTATAQSGAHDDRLGWGVVDAFAAVTVAQDPVEAAKDKNVFDTSLGVCPDGIFGQNGAGPVFDPGHAYVDTLNTGLFNEAVDIGIPDEVIASGTFVVENETHGLVIPPSTGAVKAKGIQFRSGDLGHLIIRTDLQGERIDLQGGSLLDADGVQATADGRMELHAHGELRAVQADLNGGTQLHVRAEGDVRLGNAVLTSEQGRVYVSGESDVHLTQATVEGHDAVRVKAQDSLFLAEASVVSKEGNVRLEAGSHASA